MEGLIFLVIIGSSIWVLIDAKSIGVKKSQIGGLGIWGHVVGFLYAYYYGLSAFRSISQRGQNISDLIQ